MKKNYSYSMTLFQIFFPGNFFLLINFPSSSELCTRSLKIYIFISPLHVSIDVDFNLADFLASLKKLRSAHCYVLCCFSRLPSKSIFISSRKYLTTLIWWDSIEWSERVREAWRNKAARAKVWWWLLTNYLLAWDVSGRHVELYRSNGRGIM